MCANAKTKSRAGMRNHVLAQPNHADGAYDISMISLHILPHKCEIA